MGTPLPQLNGRQELPPDLPRLRTLVTYLRGRLIPAERTLNIAEEREATHARRQPLPEPPAWLIEPGFGAGQLPGPRPRRGLLGQPTLHRNQ
ncbi:hypothetical protein ACFXB4_40890 [Streptomyces lavendulae]|uniref:hypothetical protein n=1 Tax=Streptomyces lavendulae TaxID=1914 RepID=UPI0036BFE7A1